MLQFSLLEKDDIGKALDFCIEQLSSIMNVPKLEINTEQIEMLLNFSIDNPDYICLLSKNNNEIIGLFGFLISNKLGLYEKQCSDILVLVKPDNRSFKIVKEAIFRIEEFCKAEKIKHITLGINLGYKQQSIKKVYEKLGYVESGFLLNKELHVRIE